MFLGILWRGNEYEFVFRCVNDLLYRFIFGDAGNPSEKRTNWTKLVGGNQKNFLDRICYSSFRNMSIFTKESIALNPSMCN